MLLNQANKHGFKALYSILSSLALFFYSSTMEFFSVQRNFTLFHLIVIFILQVFLTSNGVLGVRHSEEYCAMYDICGRRSDGKNLNCPFGSPSVKPDDLLSLKIQSLCPTITGNVFCTEAQFDSLRAQVQQVIPFLVGCPACLRNFLNHIYICIFPESMVGIYHYISVSGFHVCDIRDLVDS